MIEQIPLKLLDPHPDNPRLELREDVIATIQAQLRLLGGYQEQHAIIVRRVGKRYQILDGHHRVEAADREAIKSIPAWVGDYTDEEAFMQLALANAQSGLTPLERGKHALDATTKFGKDNGLSILEYASKIKGVTDGTTAEKKAAHQEISRQIRAYLVYQSVHDIVDADRYFSHFAEIHAAPEPLWPELVKRMMDEGWTVAITRAEVKRVQPPRPAKGPDRMTRVTITKWKEMSEQERTQALKWRGHFDAYRFVPQKTDYVEWAQWSHNPVTGCGHNCPYCYAREIAERIYEEGFEPTFHASRLNAPYSMPVPKEAAWNMSYRNVFICSMADLFGQWVPREWIEAVLETVRENPQWNFLFLSKFPIRMAEFEFSDNAWVGTSVDLQARVRPAQRAMEKIKAAVKWLSVEPMIESLHFDDLSLFQWLVIGGATKTNSSMGPTPEWKPPKRWVMELTLKGWDAGCKVYHKTNLNNDRIKQFPNDPNPSEEPTGAPAVFHYLKEVE